MNTTDMKIPSNRVSDIRRYCHAQLRDLYPAGEVEAMTRMLFEAFLGWNLTQLMLHGEDTINQSDLLKFHWAVEDLKRYRPIQHIIGYVDFCDCRINVSPDALIPRPETEEIIHRVIDYGKELCNTIAANSSVPRILDLCSGSGCMAIALAHALPQAKVTAVELSDKALSLARQNAEQNKVDIEFVQADILDTASTINLLRATAAEKFCIIVSNPPYIAESESAMMQRNVTDYEPEMALYVPDSDPLLFYRAIARLSDEMMLREGFVALEINERFGNETAALFSEHGYSSQLQKDFRDKDRMLICRHR